MRLRTLALAAALFATVFVSVPHVSIAQQIARLAPADEYFGRLKMSILGIRNRISELENETTDPAFETEHVNWKLAMVEDAIADWKSKYPDDPWIPRFRTRLGVVYARIGALH